MTIDSQTGHKLPSGVGFRRAFVELSRAGPERQRPLGFGPHQRRRRDRRREGQPVAGELWWKDDCSARLHPDKRRISRIIQVIRRQDQAQIYQELVTAPPRGKAPECGLDVRKPGRR